MQKLAIRQQYLLTTIYRVIRSGAHQRMTFHMLREAAVKRSVYGDHDYTFGQLMLILRMTMDLTQAGLAERLGVSRHAVSEWEAGSSYPKVERLTLLIDLGVRASAFPAGREEEEIRALWHAAHQKMLLDEAWLQNLLAPPAPVQPSPQPEPQALHTAEQPAAAFPRIDWVGALDVSYFAGREVEVAELSAWILQERCRLIALVGMGGIGKSMLASYLEQHLAQAFEAVLWRSVRDAPPCEELVADCITFFSETPPAAFPTSLEQRISQLLTRLQAHRCLLVLDNLEALLASGDREGNYLQGYEGYGRLIGRLAESAHQSCVLLTSREKPKEIEPLEGVRSPVRSLRLVGMDEQASHELLSDKELRGTPTAWGRLVASYAGNPLALKIVAQTILELFDGDLDRFLEEGELIWGGIRPVLRQQVGRLTPLEHLLLTWLAVLREWTELPTLLQVLHPRALRAQVLEALEALRRRSLVERGQQASFGLQSVVMEYLTEELGERLCEEIVLGNPQQLRRLAIEQAQAKDYVREIQVRLLVHPLNARLRFELGTDVLVEEHLLSLLAQFRAQDTALQGYGPANVISLLKDLRGHLRGLDLSRLSIRGAYLQGVDMQDASLMGAHLQQVRFTEVFDVIYAVAISPDGRSWAGGGKRGEVRIWHDEGQTAYVAMQAHTNRVSTVAFSPDGRTLASGSWDCSIKLWDVASTALLWSLQGHQGYVQSVAFSPDGRTLASGSDDGTVKLWDLSRGRCERVLTGHQDNVYAVAWHPDGHVLASGSFDQTIRLWDVESGHCLRTLTGHTHWVMRLAFTPDGKLLASGGADNLVKVWELVSGHCQHTLPGHTNPLRALAWSPDGHTLVSGSWDKTIRVWQPDREITRQILLGHTDLVQAVAFTPDGKMLLSGSTDQTVRVWDSASGECLRILQGYSVSVYTVTWSPDGRLLASGGTDCKVTLWDIAGRRPIQSLAGHTQSVETLAWHPGGALLASGSHDQSVRIWDTQTGTSVQLFQAQDQVNHVAWSPDGAWLASEGYDCILRVWDRSKSTYRWTVQVPNSLIRGVCWSPDGSRLATGGDDHAVRLWRATDGLLLQTLEGHSKDVVGVAWSPDGSLLASCGGGGNTGEVLLWDGKSGALLRSLVGHPSQVFAIAWHPQGNLLVSAGIDGTLRWWDVARGATLHARQGHQAWINEIAISPAGDMLASCGHDGVIHVWEMQSAAHLFTLRSDRPYERMAIMGTTGLTNAQQAALQALGASSTAAWAEGRGMTPDQALTAREPVTLPRETQPSSSSAKAAVLYPNDLTAREVEVLRLLAQGLTDAQIAEQLVISVHTAHNHVKSILSKLGVPNRSAASTYAKEHKLV
jgi:WD40 repeat protein/DNA-binding CsgD family transcriptional regulator/transcriptional regulator with XRE-family HTH domain